MRVCIGGALAVLAAAAVAAAGAEEGGGLAAGLQLALSTYRQCESAAGAGGEAAGSDAAGADALACLKMHALRALQRALAKDALPLADGLALVRAGPAAAEDGAAEENAAEAAAVEAEASAGTGAGERRQARLDALLAAHATRLLRSRALAVSVPRVLAALLPDEEAGEEQGAQEEGRRQSGLGGLGGGGGGGGGGLGGLGGKRRGGKKGHGAMLLAMLMKGSMIAYAYKALAVVAGKALLVAKVALVLASVMGLSHLVGHKAPATTYEIVKQPVVHGYHQLDDHHHFDVADIHGHGGGFGGGGGGGAGGGAGGGGGWGRAAVGRSLSAGAGPAAPPPASPPPASQLVAPEAATTPEAAAAAAAA